VLAFLHAKHYNEEVAQRGSDSRGPRIPWDQVDLDPVAQIKVGITRERFPLARQDAGSRSKLLFTSPYVSLQGYWSEIRGFGSRLTFTLTNVGGESVRITRLTFPTDNGIDPYLASFDTRHLSFLRNGYQSWSTARSYTPQDKPLRPWLQLVSLASSNMANLPSNVPGVFSSEMFTIITNRSNNESFLVGQGRPFNQFFYIRLNAFESAKRLSYFEFTYDFGRKMLMPGESIELDGIVFARGNTHRLVHHYLQLAGEEMEVHLPTRNYRGWSSWYFYYTKITPQAILKNVAALKTARDARGAAIDFVQIDDGYQHAVGDWLRQSKPFEGQMKLLADAIRGAGFTPGIWLAPFIATKRSELMRIHPEYALRDEHGRRITAGYNIFWPGHYYYGLDITNPRFEEYLRRVIRTIVGDWGYVYLKLDFLFAGCLRGGTHHDLGLSRAEVLKQGMRIIREEAERAASEPVHLIGCGMPLSTGIGTVDAMRVGPDTGHFWIKRSGQLLRTGAMVGLRNSVRNSLVRGAMHRTLWLNDPDCLMLRTNGTKLSPAERRSQINAIVLTGGLLLYSDDFERLSDQTMAELSRITELNDHCFNGRLLPVDVMERELPQVVYNTAGFLGVFNTGNRSTRVTVNLRAIALQAASVASLFNADGTPGRDERKPDRSRIGGLLTFLRRVAGGRTHDPRIETPQKSGRLILREAWTGEEVDAAGDVVVIGPLARHESRLFELVTE
jgi:alpha-galactosidase